MGHFAARTAPDLDTAKDCPTPVLEDEQSGTTQCSRQSVNRGPNGHNGSAAKEEDTRLEEADEDDTNGCERAPAQDCLADESNDYTQ